MLKRLRRQRRVGAFRLRVGQVWCSEAGRQREIIRIDEGGVRVRVSYGLTCSEDAMLTWISNERSELEAAEEPAA